MEVRWRDDLAASLVVVVDDADERMVAVEDLRRAIETRPLPHELREAHATVTSIAAAVRAAREPAGPVRRPAARRPFTKVVVAAATIVLAIGSSLALTGGLPDEARDVASEALAGLVPPPERITVAAPTVPSRTDRRPDPVADGPIEVVDERGERSAPETSGAPEGGGPIGPGGGGDQGDGAVVVDGPGGTGGTDAEEPAPVDPGQGSGSETPGQGTEHGVANGHDNAHPEHPSPGGKGGGSNGNGAGHGNGSGSTGNGNGNGNVKRKG